MPPELTSERLLEIMQDPDYWRQLCPGLHIEDQGVIQNFPIIEFDPEFIQHSRELLVKEGYLEFPPSPREFQAVKLANAVKTLDKHGWMTPFGFIYDEFWCLFRSLYYFLGAMLGEDYKMLPDFWIWMVRPELEEAGWGPHRDKGRISLFEDGSPKSLTVWIALSDATTLNGCMYVLPAHLDPVYNTEHEKPFQIHHQLVRALPAQAGTAFCWNQAVIHWGSASSKRAKGPRISTAFEFQRGDLPPFNQPLMDPMLTPAFSWRLWLISKQILQYTHMYPLSPMMEEVAKALKNQPAKA